MIQLAKLTNGQLHYFTVGETIMIGNKLVTNPSIDMLETEGYKEVIHTEGNGGVYEDGNYIIIETPAPAPLPVLTPAQLREQAYQNDKIIEWQGEMLTCDEARLNRMSAYYYSGQTEKLGQLQELWMAARESIQLKYPDYGTIQ